MILVTVRRAALGALVAAALAACSDTPAAPPVASATDSLTVNAAAAFTYLALGTPAAVVPVINSATDAGWDMGFFATTVTLNGGAAGPGGVSGYCLRCNDAATNAELQAMTPANQLAAFDSVTTADIPTASAFVTDELAPAIHGWYTGSGATASVTPGKAWIVIEGSGANVVLAKFRVTLITGASATSMGQVSFEFAVQPAPGQPFGAVQTPTVNASGPPVYFDLTTAQVGSAANWDLEFDGWSIRVNGGVSGTGTVKAVVDSTTAFAAIDAAYASTAPPQAFRADGFSGVFGRHPWYRYNITGTDNQIWPTYSVYLVGRGTSVYKVQLTGYYDAAGTPRQVTVRYAKVRN